MCGTGTAVKHVMHKRNFQKFHLCESQSTPDTNFGGFNPEERQAFSLAIQEASPEDELILATDPDADFRMGILCKKKPMAYNQWQSNRTTFAKLS